jgi:malate dehydrogenase (oxaloacetate-decarboxylating)(NADP+)
MNDVIPTTRAKRPTFTDQEALQFHAVGRPGKLEIVATKPMATQRDLSLAYSPGVAVPVLAIAEDPALAYDYTTKGNMVAVITNGTAILGLGNRGALASKPVMEGKAVLFKRFADIDSFDLEVDTEDPDAFIQAVRYLGPCFGGINLEDIKAPECFIIEQRLQELMPIPVFHDDQHGTAIIAAAGPRQRLPPHGPRHEGREARHQRGGRGGDRLRRAPEGDGLLPEQRHPLRHQGRRVSRPRGRHEPVESGHAAETTARSLADAMEGADAVFGLSAKGAFTPDMIRSMAANPHHLRDGEPGPGNHPGGGRADPGRRHHGDRPLRLSEPDQQRARLSLTSSGARSTRGRAPSTWR